MVSKAVKIAAAVSGLIVAIILIIVIAVVASSGGDGDTSSGLLKLFDFQDQNNTYISLRFIMKF